MSAKLRTLFDRMDRNKNGKLEAEEIKTWLNSNTMGLEYDDEEVADNIASMDTDADGRVSFEEWNKVMLGLGLSDDQLQAQIDQGMEMCDRADQQQENADGNTASTTDPVKADFKAIFDACGAFPEFEMPNHHDGLNHNVAWKVDEDPYGRGTFYSNRQTQDAIYEPPPDWNPLKIHDFDPEDGSPDKQLIDAAWDGAVSKLLTALENGANINCQNAAEATPLQLAACEKFENRSNNPPNYECTKNYTAIVMLLLNRGADPDIPDYEGQTPLMAATFKSNACSVEMLLAAGARTDFKDTLEGWHEHEEGTGGGTALDYVKKSTVYGNTNLGINKGDEIKLMIEKASRERELQQDLDNVKALYTQDK